MDAQAFRDVIGRYDSATVYPQIVPLPLIATAGFYADDYDKEDDAA